MVSDLRYGLELERLEVVLEKEKTENEGEENQPRVASKRKGKKTRLTVQSVLFIHSFPPFLDTLLCRINRCYG
jgi:hypothetical protein